MGEFGDCEEGEVLEVGQEEVVFQREKGESVGCVWDCCRKTGGCAG